MESEDVFSRQANILFYTERNPFNSLLKLFRSITYNYIISRTKTRLLRTRYGWVLGSLIKTGKTRRRLRLPPLPLSWTLHTLVCWVKWRRSRLCTTPTTKKTKRSESLQPSANKKKSSSSKPSAEDLKQLDEKWAERFSRLEAMLLTKTFTVPVEPVVKPASDVTTSQKPFF